jgi:hypothetical protein
MNRYIDPAEEMKQQPVTLSIGTSDYKETATLFRLCLMVTLVASLDQSRKTFFKSMIEAVT